MSAAAVAGCQFCAIVAGERDAEIVLDEAECLAFLDHRPLFPGHVLLIPRQHHETIEELPADELHGLFEATQRLSRAVREAMEAKGTFVAINNRVSQSVPHLHVHIVPRRPKDGLRGFFWPRNPYGDEGEMREAGERIRAALDGRGDG